MKKLKLGIKKPKIAATDLFSLAILTLCSLLFYFKNITLFPRFFFDEGIYMDIGKNLVCRGVYGIAKGSGVLAGFHTTTFLLPLMLAASFSQAGFGIFQARIVCASVAVLTPLAVYFVGKKMFSWKVGFVSALLYALLPITVKYSRMALADNLAALFFLISLYVWFSAKKDRQLFLSGFLAFIGFLVKPSLIMFFPIIVIATLLFRDSILKVLAPSISFTAGFSVLAVILMKNGLLSSFVNDYVLAFKYHVKVSTVAGDATAGSVSVWLSLITQPPNYIYLFLLFVLGVLVALKNLTKEKKFLLIWIVVYASWFSFSAGYDRYVLPLLVPLILLSNSAWRRLNMSIRNETSSLKFIFNFDKPSLSLHKLNLSKVFTGITLFVLVLSVACTAWYTRSSVYYLTNEDNVAVQTAEFIVSTVKSGDIVLCDEVEIKVLIEDYCLVYNTWDAWQFDLDEIKYIVVGLFTRSMSSSVFTILEEFTLVNTFYSSESPYTVLYEIYSH